MCNNIEKNNEKGINDGMKKHTALQSKSRSFQQKNAKNAIENAAENIT